nr:hypothetical protein [Tanacetum cinerariifolium]
MEYLVKISKKTRILKLKQRNMKITDSENQYAVSNKEDTVKKHRLSLKNDMQHRD